MKSSKIAIVGGGIAGVAAAWSLDRAGHCVELFERSSAVGGNAKTFRWPIQDAEGNAAESPLLVVAWPEIYYHNYQLLLEELGLNRTSLPISYFVRTPDGDFRQDGEGELDRKFAAQFRRWDRLVAFVTAICNLFVPKKHHPSAYHFSYFNPMNIIPIYWLARLFGISRDFWDQVFVTVHCATFITTKMKRIPAVVLPILESIVPLERPCRMETWDGPPRQVFERMTEPFADRVHTHHEIVRVARQGDGYLVEDAEGRVYEADKVVFACDAHSALASLEAPTRLQRLLLGNSQYVDDVDPTFSKFVIHSDDSVFPEDARERIGSTANTYVEVDERGDLECTFVLSSQYPGLPQFGVPMLVTFNSKKRIDKVVKEVALPRPNHTLCLRNLLIMASMRFLQGKDDLYYCGTFTTPEGGHDLSFMSGLVAAHAMGAPYPLPQNRPEAIADFHLMQRIMLGKVLEAPAPASRTAATASEPEPPRPVAPL